MILRFASSGLDLKIANDMAWDLQRSDAQHLLDSTKSKSFSMADVVERKLNLADTEGMFLLMAIGYILAGSVLFSEIVGGCAKSCRTFIRRQSNVGDLERRGSNFSSSQISIEEPKTFSDKIKSGIRRRLRSKPKPKPKEEEPKEMEEQDSESKEPDESGETGIKPEFKGTISFHTLKRIMMMRKRNKDEKKEIKDELKDATVDKTEGTPTNSPFENHLDFEEGEGRITIENEKSDGVSLIESSSIFSETQMIKEQTEVEINQLSVSDRENNPSKEFGEIV